jgi:hypothetical protein
VISRPQQAARSRGTVPQTEPPTPKDDVRTACFFTPVPAELPCPGQPLSHHRANHTTTAPPLQPPESVTAHRRHSALSSIAGEPGFLAQPTEPASSDDSDPPSPKWDETTCFFTRPQRRQHTAFSGRDADAGRAKVTTGSAVLPSSALEQPTKLPIGHTVSPIFAMPTDLPANAVATILPLGSGAPAQDRTPAREAPSPMRSPAFTAAGRRPSTSLVSGLLPGSGTLQRPHGARFRASVPSKGHQLTILSLEIVACCRGQLVPDPKYDSVLAISLAVWYDHEAVREHMFESRLFMRDMTSAAPASIPHSTPAALGGQVDYVADEPTLLQAVLKAVKVLDPDVIVAFDLMRGSVGYLEARGKELGMTPTFLRQLGRCPLHPGACSHHPLQVDPCPSSFLGGHLATSIVMVANLFPVICF